MFLNVAASSLNVVVNTDPSALVLPRTVLVSIDLGGLTVHVVVGDALRQRRYYEGEAEAWSLVEVAHPPVAVALVATVGSVNEY